MVAPADDGETVHAFDNVPDGFEIGNLGKRVSHGDASLTPKTVLSLQLHPASSSAFGAADATQ
jgi:hypothetical protein